MKLSTSLTLAMGALVLATATIIGAASYRALGETARTRDIARLEANARQIANLMAEVAGAARDDVLAVSHSSSVMDLVANWPAATEPRRRLAVDLAGQLEANADYLQFRLIGVANDGRELVRLDRSGPGGAIRAVPDDELQPKGDRDYFEQTLELADGEFFVTPIELNQEFGEIQTPHVPVMRIATPLRTAAADLIGVLIINVDMGRVFGEMQAAAERDAALYVTDEAGRYLVAPTPGLAFGFETGAPRRLGEDFPALDGADVDGRGAAFVENVAGEGFGAATVVAQLAGGHPVRVALLKPERFFAEAGNTAARASLVGALIAALIAIVAAALLARRLARPIEQVTDAVNRFRGGAMPGLPTAAGGEVGVLARAVDNMGDEIRRQNERYAREIEERRRIADQLAALAEKERIYREAIDSSSDAVVILDAEGKVVSWNAAATRLYGWTEEEMTGGRLARLAPKDRADEIPTSLATVAAGGRVEQFETVRVGRDRRRIHVSVSVSPIVAADGRVIGACKISRDITERRLEEEKFRLAIEASPSGMLMTDASGVILMANAEMERLFGYDRDELLGAGVEMLVPEEARDAHPALRAGFAAAPVARRMGADRDLTARRKDGREFIVEVRLNPIEGAEGLMILGVVVDISARREAEERIARYTEELKRSNAELEEFAYVAAHDLQEPIRMVGSFTQLLASRYEGRLDEKADKYIGYVVEGATRMKQLVDDLLVYSRVGTQGREPAPVELRAVVDRALADMARPIRKLGATVEVGALPEVMGDEGQLIQLFSNLFSNALKFRSEAPPLIRVSARRVGELWQVSVADNGIGIDRVYGDRIFQMFQRLNDRDQYEGSGIGLSVARKIVERHGGRIDFDSAPGEGATFRFTLRPAQKGDYENNS